MSVLNLNLVLSWKFPDGGWEIIQNAKGEWDLNPDVWSVPGVPFPKQADLEDWQKEWELATGGALAIDKAKGKLDVNNMIDVAVDQHPSMSKYPKVEQGTFTEQRNESAGWLANKDFPTPFIDAAVAASSIWKGKKKELCEAVLANSAQYIGMASMVISVREQAQAGIDICTSVAEVNAVVAQVAAQLKAMAG